MRKPSRKLLRRKLDKLCSEIVRARGYCVWCGQKSRTLQCAHIFTRSYLSTRWDLKNLLCLCAQCHFRGHKEPIEFVEFVKKFLGEKEYAELRIRAHLPRPMANFELDDLYKKFLQIKPK